MNTTNIQDYCCGSFSLVERDLRLVLEPEVAQLIINEIQTDMRSAFRLREELINMKKVAYHMQKTGNSIERSLAQLATFFRDDVVAPEVVDMQCWVHSDRLTAIAETRMRCKGACAAITDARSLAKVICCVPRHPSKPRPAKLEGMPQNLETALRIRDAHITLGRTAARGADTTSTRDAETKPAMEIGYGDRAGLGWRERVLANLQTLAANNATRLPPAVMEFVTLVLVCRGADKALRIVDEVLVARRAVRDTIADLEAVLPPLRERQMEVAAEVALLLRAGTLDADTVLQRQVGETRSQGILLLRHLNLLGGALPQLRVAAGWLDAIAEVAEQRSERVVFLAGDVAAGQSLPAALSLPSSDASTDAVALFATYRAVEVRFRPEMRAAIARNGWPAFIDAGRELDEAELAKCPHNKCCRFCRRMFTVLWVHCGVCCECEDRIRSEEHRCPYRDACKPSWFCPHASKCLICDAHSCDACQLHRGDAETVTELARRLRPRRVALDFDRTVSSTRSGTAPVTGRHEADVDLVSLMWEFPSVIVTRNQNREAIRAFLGSQGAPADIEICTVAKKESKSQYVMGHHTCNKKEFICGRDGDSQAVLFVDDSIQELVVDFQPEDKANLHRVLFVRGLV